MDSQFDCRYPADPAEQAEDGRWKGVGEQDRREGVGLTAVGEPDPADGLGLLQGSCRRIVGVYPRVDTALDVHFDTLFQSGTVHTVFRKRYVGHGLCNDMAVT